MSTEKYSQVKIGELIPFGAEVFNEKTQKWEAYYYGEEEANHTNLIINPKYIRFKKEENHVDA
jgi:hypothetical protein